MKQEISVELINRLKNEKKEQYIEGWNKGLERANRIDYSELSYLAKQENEGIGKYLIDKEEIEFAPTDEYLSGFTDLMKRIMEQVNQADTQSSDVVFGDS